MLAIAAVCPEAPRWSRGDFQQALASQPLPALRRIALAALAGEEIAGFAIASCLHAQGGAECEIESLAVPPALRRRGIASALLAAIRAWAARSGAGLVRLEVRPSNHAALALYRAHHFQLAGRRAGYYREPVEDALVLQLATVLPSP